MSTKPEVVAALKQNPQLLLPANLAPYPDTVKVLGVNGNSTLTQEQTARIGQELKDEYKLDGDDDNAGFIRVNRDSKTKE